MLAPKSLCATALGLLGALSISLAAPARAVPVDVTYDIFVQVNIPAFGVSPAFSGPGTQTIRFANGTAGGHVGAGLIDIVSGSASLTANFTLFGDLFTGTQRFVNLATGVGYVAPGGTLALTTRAHITMGFIHCHGGTCGAAGFASSVPEPLTSYYNSFSQSGMVTGFPSGGPQYFQGQGNAGTFGGAQLTAIVTGREVSRTVVPEPGTGALLALGLAGLGIAGTSWRARRRR